MELLKPTWYFDQPFDYEIKQYKLLSYLRYVEDCFLKKILSPHLLHLEKIEKELSFFKNNHDSFMERLEKKKYLFFENEEVLGLEENNIPEIYDIVVFSIPQVKSKIIMGYKIFERYNQILY